MEAIVVEEVIARIEGIKRYCFNFFGRQFRIASTVQLALFKIEQQKNS
jgi:hypothetical protein